MKRSGSAVLPLHGGHAPSWLVGRMKRLAAAMVTVMINEYGRDELLRRLSDPFWFQSLGCVLGYDWHSSGVTTVLTGVLREAVSPREMGLAVCGGKGKRSRKTLDEIQLYGSVFGLSGERVSSMRYASRMAAKVDNAAIQAGYPLYHHAFVMTSEGKWAVIQQGMSSADRTARRYHWMADHVRSFVEEPHDAIVGDAVRARVLDMTAKESDASRKVSVDVVKEGDRRLRRMIDSIPPEGQKRISDWTEGGEPMGVPQLRMPRRIDWSAMRAAYEVQPSSYEELLAVRGVGPGAVRALSLVSQLIYGTPPSWRDPVRFSFALGGKDGVPFPVDRRSYDQTIQHISRIIEKARLEDGDRYGALRRLRTLTRANSP